MNNKPRIFIGSSVEGLSVAYAIQQNLRYDAEITPWSQGVFELSQTAIESLMTALGKADFGIFIFTPDDIIKMRKQEHTTVRDNVLFELGLFIGKLGRERCFIVKPDNEVFHIPTDLLGITFGTYEANRTDEDLELGTGPVCGQIRKQVKKLGSLLKTLNADGVETESKANEDKTVTETDWWDLYNEKKYPEAINLIDKELPTLSDINKKKELEFWKLNIEYKLNPLNGKIALEKKIDENPDDSYTYIAASKILLWAKDYDFSAEVIKRGLDRFPDNDILKSRKVSHLNAIGKTDKAIELLLLINPEKDDDLTIRLAEMYENSAEPQMEMAYAALLKRYKKQPHSERIAFKLARLAQETDRDKLALYLLNELKAKYPDNKSYLGYYGNSCLHLELTNSAMIAYKKVDELSKSTESWILSNIGNVFQISGLYTDARNYFDQALKLDPDSDYDHTRIAEIVKLEDQEAKKIKQYLKEGLSELVDTE